MYSDFFKFRDAPFLDCSTNLKMASDYHKKTQTEKHFLPFHIKHTVSTTKISFWRFCSGEDQRQNWKRDKTQFPYGGNTRKKCLQRSVNRFLEKICFDLEKL